MQIPGLLVEYLISGSVALIWLLPALRILGYSPLEDARLTALLLPGLYVLGMLVDFLGWFILRPYKKRLKREIFQKHQTRI